MTGFGQGAAEAAGVKVAVELRSVNNRFADLKLRLPDELAPMEADLRRRVLGTVRRGRIDAEVRIERTGRTTAPLALNRPLVESVLGAWKTLRDEFGVLGEWDLPTMMRVPGLLEPAPAGGALTADEISAVEAALDHALSALDGARAREGVRLQADLLARVGAMDGLVRDIRGRAAGASAAARDKLLERVQALAAQVPIDPARLAQEAAFLADRADVTEEIVRLEGHLAQARSFLAEPDGEPVGKRMDFLLQEIHRETNTIASKSQDLDISRRTLDLKAESEKIREQIQNLE